MPVYDYLCEGCKAHFEAVRKIDERDEPCQNPCPKCSEKKLTRILSASPGIVSGVGGQGKLKLPSGFKDVLKEMHKRVPGSKLNNFIP